MFAHCWAPCANVQHFIMQRIRCALWAGASLLGLRHLSASWADLLLLLICVALESNASTPILRLPDIDGDDHDGPNDSENL